MSRDTAIGIVATFVSGAVFVFIGRDWLAGAFSSDPVAAACFTLCAFGFGVFACATHDRFWKGGLRHRIDELDRYIEGLGVWATVKHDLELPTQDDIDELRKRLKENHRKNLEALIGRPLP